MVNSSRAKYGGLDQYYTSDSVAQACVDTLMECLPPSYFDGASFIEPSAGGGSFVRALEGVGRSVYALDIAPASPGIHEGDFFEFDDWGEGRVVVVGNPPFGFASSLAIAFFQKAAERADVVAFVVPRTFRKRSVQQKLNRYFHLVTDMDIPSNAFLLDGEAYDVPCVFQVWVRGAVPRVVESIPDVSSIMEYVRDVSEATFALRRVGGRAGAVLPIDGGETYSKSSTYFIKSFHPEVKSILSQVDWDTIRNNTAGVRSISKIEIAMQLKDIC